MAVKVSKEDLLWVVDTAIEGTTWLIYKWEGEYGNEYPLDIKTNRITELRHNIKRFRGFKKTIKEG